MAGWIISRTHVDIKQCKKIILCTTKRSLICINIYKMYIVFLKYMHDYKCMSAVLGYMMVSSFSESLGEYNFSSNCREITSSFLSSSVLFNLSGNLISFFKIQVSVRRNNGGRRLLVHSVTESAPVLLSPPMFILKRKEM